MNRKSDPSLTKYRPIYSVELILVFLICSIIVSIILLSCVPPISRDALTHHLAIPKLYLKAGGMIQIPSLAFSYYPMNIQLFYLIPLYLGNDIIPKFIHFSFALMTAWLLFMYLNRRLSRVYGLLGVLFFLSIPIIIKLSITVYVDLGLIFFSTLSLMLVTKWLESSYKMKYLFYAAISCGLALGTKYNGLILLFILAVLIPFIYSRTASKNYRDIKSVSFAVFFVAIALIVFSPWMIRNYVWTGNPIYPLYNTIFKENARLEKGADHAVDEVKLNHFMLRKMIYNESPLEIASIPLRIFFQGRDNDPQYFDRVLTPFLLFLPLFSLITREKSNSINIEKKLFLWFSLLFLLFAFLLRDMRIRYIGPIIPPLVILSVFGLRNLFFVINTSGLIPERRRSVTRVALSLIMIVVFLNSSEYVREQFEFVEPFAYLKGDVSREEYIGRYRSEYKMFRYINENIPENSKILSFFLGHRSYYCNREMVFNESLLGELLKSCKTNQSISDKLQKHKITHLLLRYDLFQKWMNDNFDDIKKAQLIRFLREHSLFLAKTNGYGLFKLVNPL